MTLSSTGYDKAQCHHSRFSTSHGQEHFFTLEAPVGLEFSESIEDLLAAYDTAQHRAGLNRDTEILLRFHLSDIANQQQDLELTLGDRTSAAFVSIVGQPPASGSKIALEAYHIQSSTGVQKAKGLDNQLLVGHGAYNSLFAHCRPQKAGHSYHQTQEIFDTFTSILADIDAQLEKDVIRTWLYCRDVDNTYKGMVDARRELFEQIGMTDETHYIASTGIEGLSDEPTHLVLIDALAVTGLDPGQITQMHAPDHMCPTHLYNVTFERGTRIMFGDRSHYYISGTASIDNKGNIVHVGDVQKQAERTLENIKALLFNYKVSLSDLKTLTVYVRDVADTPIVQTFLKENLPKDLPYILVKGAVCRPTWLIEMEGIAVSTHQSDKFPPFC